MNEFIKQIHVQRQPRSSIEVGERSNELFSEKKLKCNKSITYVSWKFHFTKISISFILQI